MKIFLLLSILPSFLIPELVIPKCCQESEVLNKETKMCKPVKEKLVSQLELTIYRNINGTVSESKENVNFSNSVLKQITSCEVYSPVIIKSFFLAETPNRTLLVIEPRLQIISEFCLAHSASSHTVVGLGCLPCSKQEPCTLRL